MFNFENHQLISLSKINLQTLDVIRNLLDDEFYALDPEIKSLMTELGETIVKLQTANMQINYTAEIEKYTELRKKL